MPFNGKDLTGWKLKGDAKRSNWKVGMARMDEKNSGQLQLVPLASDSREAMQLVNVKGGGVDIYTEEKWGDAVIEVELMVPKGSNSGIYVQGEYEVQVLDSFDNRTYSNGQAASIYKQSMPLANASRRPGEWQTYDIVFTAPRFAADGTLVTPASLTVFHNGVLVQHHVELGGRTVNIGRPAYEPHPLRQPIMLQDHGNPVRFRNVWVREIDGR